MPAVVAAVINASDGGVGPNEDLEGMCSWGRRGSSRSFGLEGLPTVVVEGKVYFSRVSDRIDEATFLVRAQEETDNLVAARSLEEACRELGYPVVFLGEALPRKVGGLREATQRLGERIAALGSRLGQATTARDQVAELAGVVGEDAGE